MLCSLAQLYYLNKKIANTTESIRNAWLVFAKPVVVRNANIVHILEKSVFLGKNQIIQAFRSRLFHSLKAEFQVHRKFLQITKKATIQSDTKTFWVWIYIYKKKKYIKVQLAMYSTMFPLDFPKPQNMMSNLNK